MKLLINTKIVLGILLMNTGCESNIRSTTLAVERESKHKQIGGLVLCSLATSFHDPFSPSIDDPAGQPHDTWVEVSKLSVDPSKVMEQVRASVRTHRSDSVALTGIEGAVIVLAESGVPLMGIVKLRANPFYEIWDRIIKTGKGYEMDSRAELVYVEDPALEELFTRFR